jgi:hypothetical protein
MNPRITHVEPHDDFTLTLHFDNGEAGVYDCSPLLDFGVFKEFRDIAYFKKAYVENGSVRWPNEQDICPDTLYLDCKKLALEARA